MSAPLMPLFSVGEGAIDVPNVSRIGGADAEKRTL